MTSTTLMANGANVYTIGPKQTDLDKIAKVYNDPAQTTPDPGCDRSEALRLAEEVSERERHVTVLFDNAGITDARAPRPAAPTAAEFRKAFLDGVSKEAFPNMNAVGLYWLTFAFRCSRSGRSTRRARAFAPQVIMTSSMNGRTKMRAPRRPAGHSYPYMFSKFAIGRATSSLAHELLPLGVRVDGTAPGLFVTSMNTLGQVDELGRFLLEVPAMQPGPQSLLGGSNKDVDTLALCLVANWYVNGERGTLLQTLLKHPSSY
ncbi:hypothetical protein BKA93DRAFT_845404 [Sparassis latifolia]